MTPAPHGHDGDRLAATYPATERSVPTARRALSAWLRAHGYTGAALQGALLAAGEAVNNAIEHGAQRDRTHSIRVEAWTDHGRFLVAVSDCGRWRPPSPNPDLRGRGLSLMRRLAHDVRLVHSPTGTTAVLELTPPRD